MKKMLLVAMLCVFCIISTEALAIKTVDQQEQISVTSEEGENIKFTFMLYNDALSTLQDVEISSSGEISPWVTFNNQEQYAIDYISGGGFAFVSVAVSVPEGTEMGTYTGKIIADGQAVSDVRVRVVLSIQDIKLLQETSEMDEEIERLVREIDEIVEELGERIDLNREDLLREIMGLSDYTIDLNKTVEDKEYLEGKVTELQNRIDELEKKEKNISLMAGRLSANNSFGIVCGIFLGGIVVFLFVKRRAVVEFFNKTAHPSKYKRKEWKE